jgi:hypothetical protein
MARWGDHFARVIKTAPVSPTGLSAGGMLHLPLEDEVTTPHTYKAVFYTHVTTC